MPENYVLFQVDGATYAVASEQVQQVEMVQSITRVPNAPDFVEGITSIRRQVVPVISLRRRFHIEPAPLDLRSRLIVVRLTAKDQKDRQVGMLVDSAREFIKLDPEQITPPPKDLTGPGVEYLEGVAILKDRLILLVNLPHLLNESERDALGET